MGVSLNVANYKCVYMSLIHLFFQACERVLEFLYASVFYSPYLEKCDGK